MSERETSTEVSVYDGLKLIGFIRSTATETRAIAADGADLGAYPDRQLASRAITAAAGRVS